MFDFGSLNPQQRLAVETIKGPVLILAGAGTGKTRVITCRIAHLVRKGVGPGNILAVTFTNKAAREMRERVGKMLPRRQRQSGDQSSHDAANASPTISTFHSLCVRILRLHIEKLGYKRNFVIYNESEQVGVVKKILAQISDKRDKVDPAAVLAMVSRLRSGLPLAERFAKPADAAMGQHIISRYESALRAANALDFDDLILLVLRLFKEHPESLEACRAKYRYVMVDEYQDTNAAQFQLVYGLTCEHRDLCVVGDDDQSIYGWRGAEISNLLDMEKFFPEVKIIKLEQNYRSTATILGAANAIIKHNVRRRGKNLWSQKGAGEKIALEAYSTDEEEARNVVEQIEYAHKSRRVPLADYAILFRTNIQSRPFETALRKEGLRYHLIGGQSFFDRREVRDFIAYLKTFVNPKDDASLLRIANTPARGLSDATMERLLGLSHERSCSVFEVMKNPAVTTTFVARTRQSIEGFVTFVERTRAGLMNSPAQCQLSSWADRFLDEIGYFVELRRTEKTEEGAEGRIRSLKDLMATMDRATPGMSPLDQLLSFLEEITLDTEKEEEDEPTGDAVTLITMHSCKGLEFPHVHVVGMEEDLLPHTRSQAEGTLDEERRLFYVAVTRAMQTLRISHCGARTKFGQPVPCHPSRFLKDLPEELVENADTAAAKIVDVESGKDLFAAMRERLA